MIRVVHLAEPSNGGVPAVMASIAEAQHRSGMEVTVMGHPMSDQRQRLVASGIRYIDVRFGSRSRLIANGYRVFRQSRNAELLHFHSSRAGLFRVVLLYTKRAPAVLFSPHGWGWLAAPRIARAPYAFVERVLVRATSLVHLLGASEEREAQKRIGLPKTKSVIIGNGVDTARFSPVAAKPTVPPGAVQLLCVGRLCRQKGQDLLLQALAGLRETLRSQIQLTFVGSGDSAQLRGLASAIGVQVAFLGHREDLVDFYRGADVVVLPSRWEGMPLVALEAISCGSPVLLTEPAADPQLRPWVMTCEATVAGVAAAIDLLASNPAERQRLRALAIGARSSIDEAATLADHVRLAEAIVAGQS